MNNDGFIDGDEAAAAIEYAEEGTDDDEEDDDEEDDNDDDNDYGDYDEEDAKDVIRLVFCACDDGDRDGNLDLDEWMGAVCENVNDHLFGYQVSEEDFNGADANGDGLCSVEEVFDYVMEHVEGRNLNREFLFSNDGKFVSNFTLVIHLKYF